MFACHWDASEPSVKQHIHMQCVLWHDMPDQEEQVSQETSLADTVHIGYNTPSSQFARPVAVANSQGTAHAVCARLGFTVKALIFCHRCFILDAGAGVQDPFEPSNALRHAV